jgi:large subunit ribosomal protein L25
MDEVVRVNVQVELTGEPEGVKTHGGVLDFVTREISVECLPGAIPQQIVLDVSELEIGDHREASDLDLPKGVELLEEADRVIVSIAAPRLEEEEEEEDDLLLETPSAEPEVIGRSKDDEAEGDDD